ncbi:hypothetical protein FNF29_03493 [Cafeteria roenbergensis]|uniref:Succinate-semialdehyde dehydrogenase, mitochondrial n=1 Tax=Cafeteria roenbergensis TaxID=33653 RepID=A0A5A8CLI7_CAFRO|nr:hypothetical protein FNF29_03493 [Cafeteria roenbergensis]|eukprot:KAA0152970.1 hypothetical protein FNF29_03493 [Cafeteria roenbergensis]
MIRTVHALSRSPGLRAAAPLSRALSSGKTLDVRSPSTGELLQTVPSVTAAGARDAVRAAAAAQSAMAAMLPAEREAALLRLAAALEARSEELALTMAREAGKPLREARGEVAYSLGFFRWFAGEARRNYGRTIPTTHVDRRLWTIRQPVGLCALISPWNFPLAMLARKLAPAIAAGCASVMKPAEDTPLTALILAEEAARCGIPPDAASLLVCSRDDVAEVGEVLATDPAVKKLSFTGSTAVGKQLASWASGTVKRVSLELGGNAPAVVFRDADIGKAAAAIVASRFRNSGQTCVCTNRVLVDASVAGQLTDAMAELIDGLVIGDAADERTDVGPLVNERAAASAASFQQQALDAGARPVVGGRGRVSAAGGVRRVGDAPTAEFDPDDGTTFFEPVLLVGASPGMRCVAEESFAPILPVTTFDVEAEAVELANHASAGLAAYAFTRDLGRALRMSEALEFGMVGVNEAVISTEVAPFGGIKESGTGREGAAEGIDEYTEVKYVAVGGV